MTTNAGFNKTFLGSVLTPATALVTALGVYVAAIGILFVEYHKTWAGFSAQNPILFWCLLVFQFVSKT